MRQSQDPADSPAVMSTKSGTIELGLPFLVLVMRALVTSPGRAPTQRILKPTSGASLGMVEGLLSK